MHHAFATPQVRAVFYPQFHIDGWDVRLEDWMTIDIRNLTIKSSKAENSSKFHNKSINGLDHSLVNSEINSNSYYMDNNKDADLETMILSNIESIILDINNAEILADFSASNIEILKDKLLHIVSLLEKEEANREYIPPSTPLKLWKKGKEKGQSAISFVSTIYGEEIKKGMKQHHLKHLDPDLYTAFHNACHYRSIKTESIIPPSVKRTDVDKKVMEYKYNIRPPRLVVAKDEDMDRVRVYRALATRKHRANNRHPS